MLSLLLTTQQETVVADTDVADPFLFGRLRTCQKDENDVFTSPYSVPLSRRKSSLLLRHNNQKREWDNSMMSCGLSHQHSYKKNKH